MVRPGLVGGGGSDRSPVAIRRSRVGPVTGSSCQPTKPGRSGAASCTTRPNSSSNTMAAGCSRAMTSRSCGAANPVLSCKLVAPSFASAAVASTKPQWLRHSTPTTVPCPIAASRNPCASALLRRCSSSKVSVRRSSTTATLSGYRAASATKPPAMVGPHLRSAIALRTSRSGRMGSSSPTRTRTRAFVRASSGVIRTAAAARAFLRDVVHFRSLRLLPTSARVMPLP